MTTSNLRYDVPSTDPDPRTAGPLYAQMIIGALQAIDDVHWVHAARFEDADPTGATDSWAALTAAAAEAIPGDPETGRSAEKGLYVGPGRWHLSQPFQIKNVLGLHLAGAGEYLTIFEGEGALDSVVDLDGIAYSVVEGFTVTASGTTTTSYVDKAFNLHWSSSPGGRSTTHVTVRNVNVAEHYHRIGFAVGTDNHDQVDGVKFYDCKATGSWTTGDIVPPPLSGSGSSHSQYGWAFGDNSAGNNVDNYCIGCETVQYAIGAAWLGSNGGWLAGQSEANNCDFYYGTPQLSGALKIDGHRSESAQRLYHSGGPTGIGSTLELANIVTQGNNIVEWIRLQHGGVATLRNLAIWQSAVPPKIKCNPGGKQLVEATGIMADAAFSHGTGSGVFDSNATYTTLKVRSYVQWDADGAVVAITTDQSY